MPGKYTSPTRRARICLMMDMKISSKIAGPKNGVHPCTAERIYAKHNEGKSFYYTSPKCGRPRKVDEAKIQEFVDAAENKDDFDVSDLHRQLEMDFPSRMQISSPTSVPTMEQKGLFPKASLRTRVMKKTMTNRMSSKTMLMIQDVDV